MEVCSDFKERSEMGKRIAAIGFIFFCTAIAWAILASTIFYRTYSSDTQLRGKVASSWGAPQEQSPPTATYVEGSWRQVPAVENGKELCERLTTGVISLSRCKRVA